jgi:predicted GNAT family acetyltransferase
LNVLIFNNKKQNRFEYSICRIRACIEYSTGAGTIVFHHSDLPDELKDLLIGHAVTFARENHLKIVATCPEVRKYIRTHAEEFVCVGKIFVAVV